MLCFKQKRVTLNKSHPIMKFFLNVKTALCEQYSKFSGISGC